MEAAQKERLAALLAEVQVVILVTQGEEWPTATMQAFAETPELGPLSSRESLPPLFSRGLQTSAKTA